MVKILNGQKLAENIIKDLKKKIKKRHLKLTLGVILVGNNKVSKIYINQKRKFCQKASIGFRLFKFSSQTSTFKLKKEIKKIMPGVSGLIIQLPLPSQIFRKKTWEGEPQKINTQEVLNAIIPGKDVDCLSADNLGKFYTKSSSISPPIVGSIAQLLQKYKIKIKGKNIVIVGAGKLVGKPLTIWFLQKEATVSVINKFTKNTTLFTKNADILISGVGRPNLITGKMIKRGAIVIDAGSSHKKGKLAGDIDLKSFSKKASYIAPVPGGVGPLTVACLIDNLVRLNI